MKLIKIPEKLYYNYKTNAIFDCYKWDPQFKDSNTLSKYVLVLSEKEAKEVAILTEKLDKETREAENFLYNNIKYSKNLKLSKKLKKEIKNMTYNSNNNIRLMRYDFHPTVDNSWKISEVNSDVPGGFAEASLLPKLAISLFNNKNYYSINFGEILVKEISKKINKNSNIALIHCTSYSDDRQVMQYLSDTLENMKYNCLCIAQDHIEFKNKKAVCILNNYNINIDFIFRFTPIEWLINIKPKTWRGYFNTITPSCNHPIALFAQTKRFPLIFSELEKNNINLSTWKKLLPKTIEVKKLYNNNNFIYKPVFGRVGEKISIKEACDKDEYKKILKDVKLHPKKYIAQEKFISKVLKTEDNKYYHLCLGSYTINTKHAGFYARISPKPRIDSEAEDIPVIIERGNYE